MIKIAALLALVLTLAGCDRSDTQPSPPQLWSAHKSLDVSPETCAAKAKAAVNVLGFESVTQNDTFTYANHGLNRAAVKCIAEGKGSFVYLAVAGPDKATVEKLRNEIAGKM